MAAAKSGLSTERQALSDAIRALGDFDIKLAELRENADARAQEMYTAGRALGEAEAQLARGHRLAVQRYETTPRSHYEPVPGPPQDLVKAVEAARERDEIATTVRYQLRGELRTAELERERCERLVADAAVAVIAQHAAEVDLGKKVADLQRQAADEGARLLWLARRNVKQDGALVGRVQEDLSWKDLADVMGAQVYETAFQALKRDATAGIR
jgi:hypothetical protein